MTNANTPKLGRREALARLGLSAVVAYSAPTILHLDRPANAVQPSCTGKGKGKGNPWCKGKGARDRDKAWRDWRDRHGSRYAYGNPGTDRDDDERHRRDRGRSRWDRSRGPSDRDRGRAWDRDDRDRGNRRRGSDRRR